MQRILATTLARPQLTCLRDCCQGESRIVSPHHRKWNGPLVLFWLHLASTIPPNAAPEAGLRARVSSTEKRFLFTGSRCCRGAAHGSEVVESRHLGHGHCRRV